MAYEYHNPHQCPLCCRMNPPIGELIIPPKECVPTPEMEKRGLRADDFTPYVKPSWLHPTPPAKRRFLLEDAGLEVPTDLEARTRHIPRDRRNIQGQARAKPREGTAAREALSPKKATEGSREGEGEGSAPSAADIVAQVVAEKISNEEANLQEVADQMASSHKKGRKKAKAKA